MLVWIVASQRLDPVPPEDGEHSETTAEAGEWSDQSNLGDGRLIAGILGARFRVSPAREHCCSYARLLTAVNVLLISLRPGCNQGVVATRG
jgi:hypothetical protein